MKQLNKLLSAFSTKTLMLLSFFALLPTMASAQCPDNNHPHMIDLGLPSGTKWACCNVGASKPEDYGGYFAWGETEGKDVYDWSTYLYGTYNEDEDYSNLVDIGIDIAGSQYDVAHVQWGASWRMPSQEQVQEFIDNCNSIWGTINGVNGWTFTGPNGSTIFLPAAGLRANEELIGGAEWGQYYSSSLLESYPCTAHIINIFKEEIINLYAAFRYYGFSVRPVVAGSSTSSGNIDFADPAVKAICVANWDTNNDQELSYAEAAAVTDIGTGFANNKDITSFDELQYFTGVTELSEAAFAFSSNLQSIVIPKSVIRIDRLLLIKCENLKSIRVDEENPIYDSRDNCNAIIETSSNTLISGCMNTVIPNSVESIGGEAFEGHSGLVSITIPNSVKVIDFGAFNGCRGLSSIIIPKSVAYIGISAFANCSGLSSIQVEDGNPNYDSRNNCNAIISTYDNGLIAGCMSTVIPNTVTSIKSFAFCGCTGLTSLDIPNSVTSIGYLAFSDCSNMTSITIPNSVITIEDAAFQNCSGISSLDFPNSLTSIGEAAFTGCTNLSAITIPESVTSIGDRAFTWCVSLEKVFSYIKEPFEIASDAFSIDWGGKSTAATLYVPAGCKAKYMATAGWNKFQNIVEMGEATGIAIDATNFPDENFRNWVLAQDYGQDGVLTEEEIAGVKEIDVGYKSITDLKGIEYFTALTTLYCYDNQLTNLDVSKNTALTLLSCGENQLTYLDVSKNTALTLLACEKNQLTYLDVSKNTALTLLSCQENQINETEMGNLVESLPANNGSFYVKRLDVSNEQNIITTEQVEAAKAKGWRVCAFDDGVWTEYDGDELQDISPVNEGETIDIGTEIDENTNLDGNVVGDVYYSISSGDGNYNAAEGCLVVTKPTDDSAIDGQDIFGEDFKDNYTGIVFKLAPGKGSIKVEAETQGNMVLKVKIGNSDPIEMELDGKLKVKFPYNVSEPTYVYIYGGMGAAGAKAMGANRAKSAADLLKIYGFEIVSDPSGIDAIENGQQPDAPVYNLNGQRVNTPGKGVYIKNGRKVLMK